MIYFNNASILSSSETKQYIGGHNFSNTEELTVKGYLHDIDATSGIGNIIISGIYVFDNIAKSQIDIISINGTNYGSGYVSDFNLAPDNWTRIVEYTAKVNITKAGNSDIYNIPPDLKSAIKDISTERKWSCNQEQDCPNGELRYSTKISLYPTSSAQNLDFIHNTFVSEYPPGEWCGSAGVPSSDSKLWKRYNSFSSDHFNKVYNYESYYKTLDCPDTGLSDVCDETLIGSANYSASRSEDGSQNSSYSLRIPKTNQDIASPGSTSFPEISNICISGIENKFSEFLSKFGYDGPGRLVGDGYGEDEQYFTYEKSYLNDNGQTETGISGQGPDGNCFISKSWSNKKNEDGSKTATVTFRGEVIDQSARVDGAICGDGYFDLAKSSALSAVASAEVQQNSGQNPAQCDDANNPDLELFTEIDSASFSANTQDGSFSASATAISYYKEKKENDEGDDNEDENSGFIEKTIVRDEPPRTEYKYYTMSNGAVRAVAYPQTSLGKRTITVTRKYKKANIFNVQYPNMPAGSTFTLSKTLTKSANSSSAEVSFYYHD